MSSRKCIIPEEVKCYVRAVLLSKIGGVPQSQFEKDYTTLVNEPLDWKSMGFKTLCDFIISIPDAARLEWSPQSEQYHVFGVGNGSFMSSSARKAQGQFQDSPERSPEKKEAKGATKNYPPKKSHNQNGASSRSNGKDSARSRSNHQDSADRYRDWMPNHNGFYSLCFHPPTTNFKKRDVFNEFSLYGNIKEVNFACGRAFVRYATKIEAIKALENCVTFKCNIGHGSVSCTAPTKVNGPSSNTATKVSGRPSNTAIKASGTSRVRTHIPVDRTNSPNKHRRKVSPEEKSTAAKKQHAGEESDRAGYMLTPCDDTNEDLTLTEIPPLEEDLEEDDLGDAMYNDVGTDALQVQYDQIVPDRAVIAASSIPDLEVNFEAVGEINTSVMGIAVSLIPDLEVNIEALGEINTPSPGIGRGAMLDVSRLSLQKLNKSVPSSLACQRRIVSELEPEPPSLASLQLSTIDSQDVREETESIGSESVSLINPHKHVALFVSNMDLQVTQEELKNVIDAALQENANDVLGVTLRKYPLDKRNSFIYKTGIIQCKSYETASKIISALNGKVFKDRVLDISWHLSQCTVVFMRNIPPISQAELFKILEVFHPHKINFKGREQFAHVSFTDRKDADKLLKSNLIVKGINVLLSLSRSLHDTKQSIAKKIPWLPDVIMALVTHVQENGFIWCQPSCFKSDNEELEKLMRNLQVLLKKTTAKYIPRRIRHKNWECAALYGNEWFRALIQTVDSKTESQNDITRFSTFYIDYGNTEIVPLESIRFLNIDWFNLRNMAIPMVCVNPKYSLTELKKMEMTIVSMKVINQFTCPVRFDFVRT